MKAKTCFTGSLEVDYADIIGSNVGQYQAINQSTWYINTNDACTYSGKLVQYEVEYYSIGSSHVAYAALWKPREDESGVYDMVSYISTGYYSVVV